jgi:hypothetical protein
MVNKANMQQVGLVVLQDSREKSIGRIAQLVELSLIFANRVNLHKGLFPTQENDVLKQIQVFFCTPGLPACSYPDSHPPTTETAIFVESHFFK